MIGSVPISGGRTTTAATRRVRGEGSVRGRASTTPRPSTRSSRSSTTAGPSASSPRASATPRPSSQPLKTGAARIALGAVKKGIPVQVVPVRPLVPPARPRAQPRPRAVRAAHHHRRRRAGPRGPHPRHRGAPCARSPSTPRTTRRCASSTACGACTGPRGTSSRWPQQAELMRRFVDHHERLQAEPDVKRLYDDVALYLDRLDALGLRDRDLQGSLLVLAAPCASSGTCASSPCWCPFASRASRSHLPVLGAAVLAGETLTTRGDVVATVKMIAATLLVLAGLRRHRRGVVLWIAAAGRRPHRRRAVLAALVVSGWATIRVLERQSRAAPRPRSCCCCCSTSRTSSQRLRGRARPAAGAAPGPGGRAHGRPGSATHHRRRGPRGRPSWSPASCARPRTSTGAASTCRAAPPEPPRVREPLERHRVAVPPAPCP